MSKLTSNFFKSKRTWSKVKDFVLGSYMPAYLAKVSRLRQDIIIIDAFAGVGQYDDGSIGSPIIIANAARQHAKRQYQLYFINRKLKQHNQLSTNLKTLGLLVGNIKRINDDAQIALTAISNSLASETVFLYLDPFGISSCDFSLLQPFLRRKASTEILINLSMPIIHRLASKAWWQRNPTDPNLLAWHNILDRVLGGTYWQQPLLHNSSMSPQEKEEAIITGYCQQLKRYLKYVGACPIREAPQGRTKYYMIFASGHPDGLTLMNDNMFKGIQSFNNEYQSKGTLFASLDWTEWRDKKQLDDMVEQFVQRYGAKKRKEHWSHFVEENFLQMAGKEFRVSINRLVDSERLYCHTPIGSTERKTKRLNPECVIAAYPL